MSDGNVNYSRLYFHLSLAGAAFILMLCSIYSMNIGTTLFFAAVAGVHVYVVSEAILKVLEKEVGLVFSFGEDKVKEHE